MADDDTKKYVSQLANDMQVLESTATSLTRSFGNLGDASNKWWTILARLSSGSGLWKFQARLRSVSNLFELYYKASDKALKATLETIDGNQKLADSYKNVEKKFNEFKKYREVFNKGDFSIAPDGLEDDPIFQQYTSAFPDDIETAFKHAEAVYNKAFDNFDRNQRKRNKAMRKEANLPFADQSMKDIGKQLVTGGKYSRRMGAFKFAKGASKAGLDASKFVGTPMAKRAGGMLSKGKDKFKEGFKDSWASGKLQERAFKKHNKKIAKMAAKAAKPDSKITALLKKRKRNKEGEDGRSSAFDFMDGGKATKKSEKIAKNILKGGSIRQKIMKHESTQAMKKWFVEKAYMKRIGKFAERIGKAFMQVVVKALMGFLVYFPLIIIVFMALRKAIKPIKDWARKNEGLFTAIKDNIIDLYHVMKDLFRAIFDGDIIEVLRIWFTQVLPLLLEIFLRVVHVLGSLIWVVAKSVIGTLIKTLKTLFGAARDWLRGWADRNLSFFASGGTVNTPLQIVGERGPELVSLPRGSQVYPNGMAVSGGGSTTINVHVNGRVGASDSEIRDIANKVAREINLRMNRTGTTGTGF